MGKVLNNWQASEGPILKVLVATISIFYGFLFELVYPLMLFRYPFTAVVNFNFTILFVKCYLFIFCFVI